MYGSTLPAPPITGTAAFVAGGPALVPLIGWSAFEAVVALGIALGVVSLLRAIRLRGRFGQ